jgi:protein-L-isoaspartate O-methyltransferase
VRGQCIAAREAPVEAGFEKFAHEGVRQPAGEGRTLSQPYIVALVIEISEIDLLDNVLEVGVRSGYALAMVSPLPELSCLVRSGVV